MKRKATKCGIFWLIRAAAAAALASHAQAEALPLSAFEVLGGADVVIVGEQHDDPIHHANQAAIARAIYPSALVFEMLDPQQAQAAQSVDRSVLAVLDDALGWSKAGSWPSFQMYYPIFANAPQARLYGAALARAVVRDAVEGGAASQFDGPATYGLDTALPEAEQASREALQAAAHCDALPVGLLSGMVEAQRLRDAQLARVTLQAFEETGGPILVITGNGHARTDWGMPAFLRRVAPEMHVISVGQLVAQEIAPPYDRWIMTGPFDAGKGDPCAALSSN